MTDCVSVPLATQGQQAEWINGHVFFADNINSQLAVLNPTARQVTAITSCPTELQNVWLTLTCNMSVFFLEQSSTPIFSSHFLTDSKEKHIYHISGLMMCLSQVFGHGEVQQVSEQKEAILWHCCELWCFIYRVLRWCCRRNCRFFHHHISMTNSLFAFIH